MKDKEEAGLLLPFGGTVSLASGGGSLFTADTSVDFLQRGSTVEGGWGREEGGRGGL